MKEQIAEGHHSLRGAREIVSEIRTDRVVMQLGLDGQGL
jgi:hypothetical protein